MRKLEQGLVLKWTVLLVLPLLLLGGAAVGEAKTFKAAMVMPGVITDKSFNQSGYEAMMLAKENAAPPSTSTLGSLGNSNTVLLAAPRTSWATICVGVLRYVVEPIIATCHALHPGH